METVAEEMILATYNFQDALPLTPTPTTNTHFLKGKISCLISTNCITKAQRIQSDLSFIM